MVNRSEVVGRPLAALLANDGACVYSVDITGVQKFTREGLKKTRHEVVDLEGWTIKDVAPLCDVVITGVPGEKYKFDTSLLREGAVCLNFSSEKVSPPSSLPVLSIWSVLMRIELRPRGQRESFDLRPFNRKGDDRCLAQESSGKCPSPGLSNNQVLIILQRLMQNRRVDDVKPAAATERPGTLEAA